MNLPPFEVALAHLATKMGLSSLELLQLAASSLQEEISSKTNEVELDPPDDYIEQQCLVAEQDYQCGSTNRNDF